MKILTIALIIAGLAGCDALAEEPPPPEVHIHVDGADLAFPEGHRAFLQNGVTLVPVRTLLESTGATVSWNHTDSSVTAGRACDRLQLFMNWPEARYNGAPLPLPESPRLIGDTLYAPLRSLAEPFGLSVTWDGESRTASVQTGDAAATCWVWPTVGATVSAEFGPQAWGFHSGIDLALPHGAPVVAARGGTVTEAGWDGGYGLAAVIDHGEGIRTRYAHASHLLVAAGDEVRAGQEILLVGATGNATGSHLHFEVIDQEVFRNPRLYLPQ